MRQSFNHIILSAFIYMKIKNCLRNRIITKCSSFYEKHIFGFIFSRTTLFSRSLILSVHTSFKQMEETCVLTYFLLFYQFYLTNYFTGEIRKHDRICYYCYYYCFLSLILGNVIQIWKSIDIFGLTSKNMPKVSHHSNFWICTSLISEMFLYKHTSICM